jgi:hypothetical protein
MATFQIAAGPVEAEDDKPIHLADDDKVLLSDSPEAKKRMLVINRDHPLAEGLMIARF